MGRRSAFTLIELLVVIAIIAVLAIVVVATLNPVQLLAQSRDSDRLTDIADLQTAINLFQIDQQGSSLGNASSVYVSIPDPVATSTAGDQCQGLGLPTLPAGYTYHCAASSTYKNISGSGWIPLNLSQISSGNPFSVWPTDPVNTSSSRLYYTYITNGSQYEVTSVMESQKYKLGGSSDAISGDGGILSTVLEKGSKVGLEPLDYGDPNLIGFWPLNEGAGSIAYDYSGNNATGTWMGTAVGTSGYYSPGRVSVWAGAFDGTSTRVYIPSVPASQNYSFSLWFYIIQDATSRGVANGLFGPGSNVTAYQHTSGDVIYFGPGSEHNTSAPSTGVWHQFACAVPYGGSGAGTLCYMDGVLQNLNAVSASAGISASSFVIGSVWNYSTGGEMLGYVQDMRLYNRLLSASDMVGLYNGSR